MNKKKNYSGRDLSPQFKSWVRKEFKRITTELTKLGCTEIQFNYGFYFSVVSLQHRAVSSIIYFLQM